MLETTENVASNIKNSTTETKRSSTKRVWKVLWTKYAPNKKRKNKNFSDGFLTWDQSKQGELILYEDQGKVGSVGSVDWRPRSHAATLTPRAWRSLVRSHPPGEISNQEETLRAAARLR